MKVDQTLKALDRLVGHWFTEATHPAMPDTIVHGSTTIEWLEGEKFLIVRGRTDHPEFPDAVGIIGFSETDRVDKAKGETSAQTEGQRLTMHYFDSRGVSRLMNTSIDHEAWRLERIAPGFSQRFKGTFTADGATIDGLWQLCEDDVHWSDDVRIIYRRKRLSA